MSMAPDAIKASHCYQMTSTNGRKVIIRVAAIFDLEMQISEQVGGLPENAFSLKNKVVRFFWRYATLGARWSQSHQQMPLSQFAWFAEDEVPCE